jgi:hypothetical protein
LIHLGSPLRLRSKRTLQYDSDDEESEQVELANKRMKTLSIHAPPEAQDDQVATGDGLGTPEGSAASVVGEDVVEESATLGVIDVDSMIVDSPTGDRESVSV